jgi:hypothetical protein
MMGLRSLWSDCMLTPRPQIPLDPRAVLKILKVVDHLPFAQATSTWPNRFVREDAKKVLQDSVRAHLAACGWAAEGDQLVPLEGSGGRFGRRRLRQKAAGHAQTQDR